jgi:hypothetical protein
MIFLENPEKPEHCASPEEPTSDVGLMNEGKSAYQAEQYEESKRKIPHSSRE